MVKVWVVLNRESHAKPDNERCHWFKDPNVARRLREAREALARNPAVLRTTDPLVEGMAPVLQQLSSGIDAWLSQIDFRLIGEVLEALGRALARLVPVNARDLGVEQWPVLQQIAADEQLCLSWVPGIDLVKLLVEAPDAKHRERLLSEAAPAVLEACRSAADEVAATLSSVGLDEDAWAPQLKDVARIVAACVRAAAEGHVEAAQALATCATDTLLTQHIARSKPHTFAKHKLRLVEDEQVAAVMLGPALAAVESSLRRPATWADSGRGDWTRGYGRNATVHAVAADVFDEPTMLKSVLLATSLLKMSVSPLLFAVVDWLPED